MGYRGSLSPKTVVVRAGKRVSRATYASMAWARRRRAAGGTENTVMGGWERWIARLLGGGVSFCVREGGIRGATC